MGTQVPGDTPNTTSTSTGGANPTPATNPTGTEVVETGTPSPDQSGGNTTPPGLAGKTTVSRPDPAATGVDTAGTGTTPAANTDEIDTMQRAIQAPGPHADTHVLVRNEDVSVIRRLWSDAERGIDGAFDRLRLALGRTFG